VAETLTWEILARDRMSEVLEKLDKTTGKLARTLDKAGSEAQQMGHKIEGASAPTRQLHSHLDRLGDGAAAALSKLKTFGIGATVALGAMATGAAAIGIKTAADNEQAAISFEVLLGSAKRAGAFLQDLKKFAAATPFDLPGLRDTASRLLAVGVQTKDVIPIMTRLGDATAGMGTGAEGIQRAVYALTQMKQSGKASLEDINQLTDAGIPALDALAAHFHKSVADIRKDISAGKITADDMFGAIEKGEGPRFAQLNGMMARQSTTLLGLWSTFKDNLNSTLADAFAPAVPALKHVLDFAARAIPDLMAGLDRFAGKVRGIFAGSDVGAQIFAALGKAGREIIPVARDALEHLFGVLQRNKDGLIQFGHVLANDVIPALGFLTKGAVGNLVLGLETLITVTAFIGTHFQQMKTVVVGALKFVADYTINYLGVVLHAADNAFGWIPGIGPKLRAAVAEFDRFAAQVRGKLDDLARPVFVPIYATYHGPSYAPIAQGSAGNIGARRLYATGGILGAASGMVLPDVIRVGENGPEELYVGSDGRGRIRPNNQTSVERTDVVEVPVSFRDPSGAEVQRALLRLARRKGYKTTAQLLPVGT
jgi:tape measure domain-containing protein